MSAQSFLVFRYVPGEGWPGVRVWVAGKRRHHWEAGAALIGMGALCIAHDWKDFVAALHR